LGSQTPHDRNRCRPSMIGREAEKEQVEIEHGVAEALHPP
jgi:hypothetical protein